MDSVHSGVEVILGALFPQCIGSVDQCGAPATEGIFGLPTDGAKVAMQPGMGLKRVQLRKALPSRHLVAIDGSLLLLGTLWRTSRGLQEAALAPRLTVVGNTLVRSAVRHAATGI